MTSQQPIACSLDAATAADQLLEWQDLQGLATAVVALDNGARMTLPIAVADNVDDLVARESACCSFLTITTTRDADTVTIEVVSDNPDARPVIAGLAGIASA